MAEDGAKETPKLVPESDLIAVKTGKQKEIDELTARLAEANQKADSHYSNLLASQAAKDKIAAELEEAKKEKEQLGQSKTLAEKNEKRVKELEKQLLDVSTQRLIQVYKIPEDKLKGKTLADLSAIEEALKLVGRESSRFDSTGAGVSGIEGKVSAMQKLRSGFDQLEKSKH